ncbi:hypothetical protein JCM8208_004313 [Rhodotorula glutinis]
MATRRIPRPLSQPRPRAPRPPPPPSTVALGTAYERLTALFLATAPQYRLDRIVRVGGKGDQGIDLRARWHLAASESSPSRTHHPVIVQCKAESSRIGPNTIRELEGTLAAQQTSPSRSSSSSPPHIGFLVALSGFTEAAIRHARASSSPIALLHLEPASSAAAAASAAAKDQGAHDWVRAGKGEMRLVSASGNRALEGLLRKAHDGEPEGEGEERAAVLVRLLRPAPTRLRQTRARARAQHSASRRLPPLSTRPLVNTLSTPTPTGAPRTPISSSPRLASSSAH